MSTASSPCLNPTSLVLHARDVFAERLAVRPSAVLSHQRCILGVSKQNVLLPPRLFAALILHLKPVYGTTVPQFQNIDLASDTAASGCPLFGEGNGRFDIESDSVDARVQTHNARELLLCLSAPCSLTSQKFSNETSIICSEYLHCIGWFRNPWCNSRNCLWNSRISR